MGFGFGQAPFQLAKCEVDTCLTTGNRSLVSLKDYDAIIFHFRATSPKDMPRSRYYHQRWIFEEIESSAYVFQDPAIYNGLFNWTMTFRRDSDIVNAYGRIFKVGSPINATVTRINYAEGKTKMAAWFVSNCYSKSSREKIVRKLQKHFEVDVFGRCGPYTCPHTKQCYEFLEKNYKFYFSFENSLCKDYVTEKLFQILKYNIVPVVYGLADYDLTAPPDSFINVLDYPDLDSLAKYLKYLDSNDTAYSMYFRWKGFFKIENGWSNTAQSFCDLCKKLHQDNTPKVYDDINKWFIIQGNCKKLKTKGWF
ncbi:Alpha-(1,3)-fucosyltransferase 7 [Halocaridina rubra]|uniref:Fucosyltransferase n=1 Tax=Halocaridina rubra TaxID=373956 RepID=A0AAN8XHW6_HALRR